MARSVRLESGDGIVAGILKFRPKIKQEELIRVIKDWMESDGRGRWPHLAIRSCAKNGALGISFHFRLLGPMTLDQFVDDITDRLRRCFGNDLAGWDISPLIVEIKEDVMAGMVSKPDLPNDPA